MQTIGLIGGMSWESTVAPAIESATQIPLLHIADPTANAIKQAGYKRVALLGTRFTMEQDFYRGRLSDVHGIEVLVPEPDDREQVHRIIYDELCMGVLKESSRQKYREIIQRLTKQGAEAVILGCTEIFPVNRGGRCSVTLV